MFHNNTSYEITLYIRGMNKTGLELEIFLSAPKRFLHVNVLYVSALFSNVPIVNSVHMRHCK